MDFNLILAVVAGITILLFLSMIHLFMIPEDVMKRDTARVSDDKTEDTASVIDKENDSS